MSPPRPVLSCSRPALQSLACARSIAVLVDDPPLAFTLSGWPPGSSSCAPVASGSVGPDANPLVGLVLLQSITRAKPPVAWLPLLEFRSPSAYAGNGKRLDRGCLPRLCSVFRLSQPLDALLLPNPSRLCFTPETLLGFLLQRFPLRTGRARLSAPLSLVAFLARSLAGSHGTFPPSRVVPCRWPSGI